jgi:ABC-type multidrug transport system ATPase subunit
MTITLADAGKRYHYEWVFRHLSYEFQSGQSYAILGRNGSGKSTLLSLLNGYSTPTEGKISFSIQGKAVSTDEIYQYVAMTAPYLELVEEFSLPELIAFQSRFKPIKAGISIPQLIERMQLTHAKTKQLRHFSSGMRQRVKLGLALYSQSPILLLDEPCSNLDREGIAWYREHTAETSNGKLLIIGSNNPEEYNFCTHQIRISDYH